MDEGFPVEYPLFLESEMSDFEEAPGKQFQDVRKQEGIVFLAYPSGSRC